MTLMRDRSIEAASIPVPEAGCWIWAGCLHKGRSYGQLRNEDGKAVYAHRWAYEQKFGPIPPDMLVCHKCDTPSCVNPDHLFLGTPSDNTQDMNAKMSPHDLDQAVKLRLQGTTYREIAAKYGVAISSVARRLRVALSLIEQKNLNPE
jgi:hypothetical protein